MHVYTTWLYTIRVGRFLQHRRCFLTLTLEYYSKQCNQQKTSVWYFGRSLVKQPCSIAAALTDVNAAYSLYCSSMRSSVDRWAKSNWQLLVNIVWLNYAHFGHRLVVVSDCSLLPELLHRAEAASQLNQICLMLASGVWDAVLLCNPDFWYQYLNCWYQKFEFATCT